MINIINSCLRYKVHSDHPNSLQTPKADGLFSHFRTTCQQPKTAAGRPADSIGCVPLLPGVAAANVGRQCDQPLADHYRRDGTGVPFNRTRTYDGYGRVQVSQGKPRVSAIQHTASVHTLSSSVVPHFSVLSIIMILSF